MNRIRKHNIPMFKIPVMGICFCWILLLATMALATPAQAQQSQTFGEYEIHYNALPTSLLSADIARAYGLSRSPNRAMVSITIIRDGEAQKGQVSVIARNLVGQSKSVEIREIIEQDTAVYYIGELRVAHMETVRFKLQIKPEGFAQAPLELDFQQQFYTE